MTKKDPVLWVVVGMRWGKRWSEEATEDAKQRNRPHLDGWDDIYALLDPSDAAELERLRKGEDEAADWLRSEHRHDCRTDGFDRAFASWVDARAARIAFEKKIGGGS